MKSEVGEDSVEVFDPFFEPDFECRTFLGSEIECRTLFDSEVECRTLLGSEGRT